MTDFDKLQERAVKLQERAAKLQEREAKLQEREGKLQEREALLNGGMGLPFAGSLLRPSGFGGFFIAAYITPVGAHGASPTNGTTVEDSEFKAIVDRIKQEQEAGATQTQKLEQPAVAKMYKEPE